MSGRPPAREAPGLFAADAPAPTKAPTHADGHRARLKARFREGGRAAVQDYELLEMLLFLSIPRADVKPRAKALLSRFGDLAHVLSAPGDRLRETPGVNDATVDLFRLIEAATAEVARAGLRDADVIDGWVALERYLGASMALREVEELRVLFLDNKNRMIADEVMGAGTLNQAPVYAREIARRALALNAAAVIMAHNHPSGDPTPSEADVVVSRKVKAALEAVEVRLHDSVVVGKGRTVSLHALGRL